ncbi:MAG: prepilin-type N-terminal cleavage/methylation domain-containing protein [bacterium]
MKKPAFTLIELLIVVAIIGILAAIAVPNFMNARIRAQVTRMLSTHNTLYKGMMMYRVDSNTFHPHSHGTWQHRPLTSPVAYLTACPMDLFQESIQDNQNPLQLCGLKTIHWEPHGGWNDAPDSDRSIQEYPGTVGYNFSLGPDRTNMSGVYDMSNGVVSGGIIRTYVPGDPFGDYKWRRGTF